MPNLLTDREFWTRYWESKTDLNVAIERDYLFHRQLKSIVKREQPQTAIELGGFPGYYTIFLKKHFGIEGTLLDYFVHEGILGSVLEANNLQKQDINVIEANLFSYQPQKRYDLVLSCGLIEHFEETSGIISKHLEFLNPGGTLFITLPNFKSLNGWVQKTFDKDNYSKHNIACMDPDLLKGMLTRLGLEVIGSGYFGRYSVWLENKQQKSVFVKAFIKTIWFIGKVLATLIPLESKMFSPYIILEAKKK